MNRKRRLKLNMVLDDLAKLREPISVEEAVMIIKNCETITQDCCDSEEDAQNNMPESFEWSAIYQNFTDNIDDLNDALADLESMYDICSELQVYDYDKIKTEVISVVNKIKIVIHR